MSLTKEYEDFIREEIYLKKLTFYESLCRMAEKLLPIPPPNFIVKNYREAIQFSHLKITPKQAFSLTVLATLLIAIIPFSVVAFLSLPNAVFRLDTLETERISENTLLINAMNTGNFDVSGFRVFVDNKTVEITNEPTEPLHYNETTVIEAEWEGDFTDIMVEANREDIPAILQDTFIVSIILGFLTLLYLSNYPLHYSILYKIRATSEMVRSVLYMTISMRISPNIENAVKFTANNLKGPLALDFKQILWDVYTRKHNSVSDALDDFINKWKKDNEEFTQAIYLIKSSSFESQKKLDESLDEAVEIILSGTKERMEHFAQDLRTPVTLFNALGILLPILGLIFLPVIGIFLQEVVKPFWIIIGYDILIPFSVYLLMNNYLEKRPYTFHHPDISRHPKFSGDKPYGKPFIISAIVAISLIAAGLFLMAQSTELFSFELLIYSLLITWGISAGIIIYTITTTGKKLKLRDEVVQMENEFAEGLFQLGNQLTRGIPLETALKNITPKMKELKISKFFETILYNIETFGMTLEQAVFDERSGAIVYYPSQTIEATMRAIVEISKKGMGAVSNAMITISKYLKDAHKVQEDLRETMGETTSTMEIQALLLAPLASGIVVALAAMIMQMLISLRQSLLSVQESLFGGGLAGAAGGGFLSSIINLDQIIPAHYFQLIVGIYMIEIVGMLAIFLSTINNGEESLLKKFNLGKTLALATIIYSLTLIVVYAMFASIIPAVGVV